MLGLQKYTISVLARIKMPAWLPRVRTSDRKPPFGHFVNILVRVIELGHCTVDLIPFLGSLVAVPSRCDSDRSRLWCSLSLVHSPIPTWKDIKIRLTSSTSPAASDRISHDFFPISINMAECSQG
ncbi:hypothetical protein V2G26_011145 [Clonostachys chloroleuca]